MLKFLLKWLNRSIYAVLILVVIALAINLVPKIQNAIHLIGVKTPQDFDICFEHGVAGAPGRVHEWRIVNCKDPSTKIQPEHISAAWGKKWYEDIDGDGVAEVIVESFPFLSGACDNEMRYVYKVVQLSGEQARLEEIEETWLGNPCEAEDPRR